MVTIPWAKLHGASTHFPIALVLAAFAFEVGAMACWSKPIARQLSSAGRYAMTLGALGSVAAVVSGLFLTKGSIWGSGDLGWHHRFVWPAFGLIIAAATWRLLAGENLSRKSYAGYVGVLVLAVGLISASGYFGGEMLQHLP